MYIYVRMYIIPGKRVSFLQPVAKRDKNAWIRKKTPYCQNQLKIKRKFRPNGQCRMYNNGYRWHLIFLQVWCTYIIQGYLFVCQKKLSIYTWDPSSSAPQSKGKDSLRDFLLHLMLTCLYWRSLRALATSMRLLLTFTWTPRVNEMVLGTRPGKELSVMLTLLLHGEQVKMTCVKGRRTDGHCKISVMVMFRISYCRL